MCPTTGKRKAPGLQPTRNRKTIHSEDEDEDNIVVDKNRAPSSARSVDPTYEDTEVEVDVDESDADQDELEYNSLKAMADADNDVSATRCILFLLF
jgi:hypothetical protein